MGNANMICVSLQFFVHSECGIGETRYFHGSEIQEILRIKARK